jgi:hypothetical protein
LVAVTTTDRTAATPEILQVRSDTAGVVMS